MSEAKRVLLVGATGLVGRKVIALAPHVPDLAVQGLARSEMAVPLGTRMELVLAQSENWSDVIATLAPQAVICALGTTQARAGSKEAFRAVDFDLVVAVAKAARAAGAEQFVTVSSVGAESHARNFYLQVKGEAENALRRAGFRRLDILRPGLLRGARAGESRPLERLGKLVSPVTDLFLHGSREKYRSIRAEDVAAAALQCLQERMAGKFVHEHRELQKLATQLRSRLVMDEAEL